MTGVAAMVGDVTDETPDPPSDGRTVRIPRIDSRAVCLAAIAVSVVVAGNPIPANRVAAAEVAVWPGVRGGRMRRRRAPIRWQVRLEQGIYPSSSIPQGHRQHP